MEIAPPCRKAGAPTIIESRSPALFPGTRPGRSVKPPLLLLPVWDISLPPLPDRVQSPCRMDLLAKAKTLESHGFTDGRVPPVKGAAALKTILDALPPHPRRLLVEPVVVRSVHRAGELLILPLCRCNGKSFAGDNCPQRASSDRGPLSGPRTALGGLAASRRLRLAYRRLQPSPRRKRPSAIATACWLLAVQRYGVRSVLNWGMALSPICNSTYRARRSVWSHTASGSIRCTRCSTIVRATAALSPTALFLTRLDRRPKKLPEFSPPSPSPER